MVAKMQAVELFRAGKYPVLDHKTRRWTHKEFTEQHLDEMVANFRRFQQPGPARQHKLKMVKGHTLYDPSAPNDGELCEVYREGKTLKFNAAYLDPDTVGKIKDKRFDDLSAEIYESPAEAGLDGSGMMLRRVAILGADVPKVKGLNPEGLEKTLRFSESETTGITVLIQRFSEYPTGRDEMKTQLLEKGMNQAVLDTLDDTQMQEICRVLSASLAPGPPAMPAEKGAAVTAFSEFVARFKTAFGEDPPGIGTPAPVFQFSEAQVQAALAPVIADIQKKANDAAAKSAESLAKIADEHKKQRVYAFCETESQSGRITPAEMDATGGPTLADRLLKLDDTAKVFSFSEGGQTKELTALDAEMRAIRQRAPQFGRNGTKIASGAAGNTALPTEAKAREDAFMSFAESIEPQLAAADSSPKELVERWKAADFKGRSQLEKDFGFGK